MKNPSDGARRMRSIDAALPMLRASGLATRADDHPAAGLQPGGLGFVLLRR